MQIQEIHLPTPCSVAWNSLAPAEKGGYCGHCSHVVVDFASMTDEELIQHIRTHPFTACGSFRADQLNRKIGVVEKLRRYTIATKAKVAAMLLSLAGTKLLAQQSQIIAISVSGIVTDGHTGAHRCADILLDGQLMCTTDSQGKFQFNTSLPTAQPQHTITARVTHGKFSTISFNNAMRSSYLEFKVDTSYIAGHRMGGVPARPFISLAYPSLKFVKGRMTFATGAEQDI
jgi:hypothetical protein